MSTNAKRYSIWSQIRDDSTNLKCFIEWHLSQGFEYFVFGDDRSIDNPAKSIESYVDRGIVEIYEATQHSESQGRYVGLKYFRPDDVIAFLDVDEFIRTKSGNAKSILENFFNDTNTNIVYLNWVLRHNGSFASSDLGDFRESFKFAMPDLHTKYIARASTLSSLKPGRHHAHFVQDLEFNESVNGAGLEPQFLNSPKTGSIRDLVRNDGHEIIKTPINWQIMPTDASIWIDHFYSKSFEIFYNRKALMGVKAGYSNTSLIRGTGYYQHGLGQHVVAKDMAFHSLNFRRLLPEIQRIDEGGSSKPIIDQYKKTIYIHFGLPKTGTTAFQEAIYRAASEHSQSPIGYVRLIDPENAPYSQNGLDLARAAKSGDLSRFKLVIEKYLKALNDDVSEFQLISSEEFSTLFASEFGLIKQAFADNRFRVCGIVVIRPFTDFAISFFKQYVSMHVQMEFHELMSFDQIAESARLHVEQTAINCMLSDDYQVVRYQKENLVNRITDFIYQGADRLDLSKYDSVANTSLSWATADELYRIRQGESLHNDFGSKEYLRLHIEDQDVISKISKKHPYFIAVDAEREKLEKFFSMFPHKHRWEHVFAEKDI